MYYVSNLLCQFSNFSHVNKNLLISNQKKIFKKVIDTISCSYPSICEARPAISLKQQRAKQLRIPTYTYSVFIICFELNHVDVQICPFIKRSPDYKKTN